jgi:hypothetical protein
VAIVRVARQSFDVRHELPALGAVERRGDARFDSFPSLSEAPNPAPPVVIPRGGASR